MRLTDKVAIITGAANGMGAIEAKLFAREGAKVAVCDITDDAAANVVDEITSRGGQAVAIHHDVTSEDAWRSVFSEVADRFGAPVNILVNNAGINGGRAAFADTSLEQWQSVMNVNATGAFLGTREGALYMRDIGGGAIVNISSVNGLTASLYPELGSSPNVGYFASKAAVTMLTKLAATQFGGWNVRVNSVHPGLIATGMSNDTLADPVRHEYFMNVIPMKQAGDPDDVAQGVVYLASDEAKFVSGAQLVIDGGYTAKS